MLTKFRWGLCIAHPGHELRVHHWLERVRPRVMLLTDGSGNSAISRLDSTARVLADVGAPGPEAGSVVSDREIYRRILDLDFQFWSERLDHLVAWLERESITALVFDGLEGYNPTHDLCHYLALAAARRVAVRHHRSLALYQFPLHASPVSNAESGCIHIELDAPALERKLKAARGYDALKDEVAVDLDRHGEQGFNTELLRLVQAPLEAAPPLPPLPPYYETFGLMRVEQGLYPEAITLRGHILPLAEALLS